MKITELSAAQEDILSRLFWLDENDDEDAEEISKLKTQLGTIRGSAENTLEFLSGLLLESRAILAGREEVKKRAEKRRKTAERSVERLTGVIEWMMGRFGIKKIALQNCDIRIQMSPGSLVYDTSINWQELPADCVKIEYKPDAAAIKAHLAAGEDLAGVSIVKKESLRLS